MSLMRAARRRLPADLLEAARPVRDRWELKWKLRRLGAKLSSYDGEGVATFRPHQIRYSDPVVFYMELKDIFRNRIYDFATEARRPRILDCGSHIGMSILYAKTRYPDARIIGFEPDPKLFAILSENVERNGLQDVTLVNAALSSHAGSEAFLHDPKDAGRLVDPSHPGTSQVNTERLSTYLDSETDFLKLNIEGAELRVLLEARDRLQNVRQMVIEYHGEVEVPQFLHQLLELLDEQGFRYLVHDFDSETMATTKPPFRLTPDTRFALCVYAVRA